MKRDLPDPAPDAAGLVPASAAPAVLALTDPAAAAPAQQALVALMARVAAGERDAFRELYASTSQRLLATARRLVGHGGVAEDVVQETYLRVWRYSRSYRPESSAPMTWITQILRNRAIDLRAYGRKEEVALTEDDGDDESPTAALAQAGKSDADAGADPRVAACFDRMNGLHRQVLTLAYHRGMSHAEIALHLGVPLGTAKTWVRRALVALRVSVAAGAGAAQAPADPGPIAPPPGGTRPDKEM